MTQGARELTPTEIEDLAAGAWILGAGGGGNPYHSLLTLRAEAARGFRPVVIPASALADDDLVAVVSTMGAPLVGEERLPDPDVAARPVQVLAERLGRPFVAVMSLEIGGANSLQSFMVAARTGLPVVDADCMGRAFPEAQMTTFAIAGLRNYPFCLADIRDNVVIVERAASWQWQERLGRVVVTEVGSIAATAKAPRTGREIKDYAILGSVTRAIRIGAALRCARERGEDPVDAVLASEGGIVLFTGKVSDMERRTTRGFLRGVATVAGLGEDRGSTMELHFQNEFAVAFRDGEPVGMTPDILTVVDSSTGEALGTEVITYGQRVRVIALASPAISSAPDRSRARTGGTACLRRSTSISSRSSRERVAAPLQESGRSPIQRLSGRRGLADFCSRHAECSTWLRITRSQESSPPPTKTGALDGNVGAGLREANSDSSRWRRNRSSLASPACSRHSTSPCSAQTLSGC